MLDNAGKVVVLKTIAKALFAISVGDGGADPVTGTAIAPGQDVTELNARVFYEEGIQSVEVVTPNSATGPCIMVRHAFNSATIPTIGREVTTLNEVAIYMRDPDTGLAVAVDIKSFQLKPGEKFRLPATGKAVSPDRVIIEQEFFQS